MKSKGVLMQEKKIYSEADVAELKRIGREIKESKKSAEYRHAIDDFIKATT
ncbi:MAG: hypothetical protein ABID38_04825 [Candidatus Diapherotrites archaeon]